MIFVWALVHYQTIKGGAHIEIHCALEIAPVLVVIVISSAGHILRVDSRARIRNLLDACFRELMV